MATNIPELTIITSVYFNQKSAEILTNLLKKYATYSYAILSKIEFIIIDDCSNPRAEIHGDLNLNYRIARINTDIPWNNGGARNLGVHLSNTENLVLTDVDHILPENLLEKLIKSKTPRKLYKFKRNDERGNKLSAAANIFFVSKSNFMLCNGYDEEFSGRWGEEDTVLVRTLKRCGIPFRYFTRRIKIVEYDLDRENSYHNLERKGEINYQLRLKKEAQCENSKDPMCGRSNLYLNFEWEIAKEHYGVF